MDVLISESYRVSSQIQYKINMQKNFEYLDQSFFVIMLDYHGSHLFLALPFKKDTLPEL